MFTFHKQGYPCIIFSTHRVKDEINIPNDLVNRYASAILDYVLYDAENCQAVVNFDLIKSNTHCTFAKTARLWGARDYDHTLSLEANVDR